MRWNIGKKYEISAQWRLKSPASGLFAQPFVQAQIKENIKALRHWHLWGKPPVYGGFPHKGRVVRKQVSFWGCHNDIMFYGMTFLN